MKTKKWILGALAIASLASCSDDKVVSLNPVEDLINFHVVSGKMTRASQLHDNNALPGEFTVWAMFSDGNSPYIQGDEVQRQSDGSYTDVTASRYWPSHDLDFYAFNGGEFDRSSQTITYTVEGNVSQQKDLLYAVATSQNKDNESVLLNFRHALSQVVFKAKDTNKELYVLIDGIEIHNLYGEGSFLVPTGTTDNNYYQGESVEPEAVTWTPTGMFTSYGITFAQTALTPDVQTLSDESTTLLLVPQKRELPKEEWNYEKGSYFRIKCAIFNISTGDVENYVPTEADCLFGSMEGNVITTADANIPVAIDWEAGRKYTYTFSFGTGDGGVDDDDNPILSSITYTVRVDDFVPVAEDDYTTNVDWTPAE
ncbi:MAG: fimbrillin family protein [Porphyromonadaceae bacterium]|nr:fimbrillin family protein [Porphyromonadaceae bacterium]